MPKEKSKKPEGEGKKSKFTFGSIRGKKHAEGEVDIEVKGKVKKPEGDLSPAKLDIDIDAKGKGKKPEILSPKKPEILSPKKPDVDVDAKGKVKKPEGEKKSKFFGSLRKKTRRR